jgi:hypothetical protein
VTTNPNAYGNIRDLNKFREQIWDWSILAGCFGNTAIRVSDVDGMVERNGRFLFIETKQPHVTTIPRGQMMAYERLMKRGGAVFFLVWGQPGRPEMVQVTTQHGTIPPRPCNLDNLRYLVSLWYQKANAKSEIRQKDFDLRGAA